MESTLGSDLARLVRVWRALIDHRLKPLELTQTHWVDLFQPTVFETPAGQGDRYRATVTGPYAGPTGGERADHASHLCQRSPREAHQADRSGRSDHQGSGQCDHVYAQ